MNDNGCASFGQFFGRLCISCAAQEFAAKFSFAHYLRSTVKSRSSAALLTGNCFIFNWDCP